MLIAGVIWIVHGHAEGIAKDAGSLVERDIVLADVPGRFGRIPPELHGSSVTVACESPPTRLYPSLTLPTSIPIIVFHANLRGGPPKGHSVCTIRAYTYDQS